MKTKKISIILSLTLLTHSLNAFNSIEDLTTNTNSKETQNEEITPTVDLKYYQLALNKANIKIDLSDNSLYIIRAIIPVIKQNLMLLKRYNIKEVEAKKININFILKTLHSINIKDFDNDVSQECKDNEQCVNEIIDLLKSTLLLNKKKIETIIQEKTIKKDIVSVNIQKFSCKVGENKTVQQYGVKDFFSTFNGSEPAHPHPVTALYPPFVNYNTLNNTGGFANYDNPHNNRQFLENIHNLPTNISSGRFYISLKSNGSDLQSNDALAIGDIVPTNTYQAFLLDLVSDGWYQAINATNPLIHTYWKNFSNILFNNGTTTLLQHVANNNHFDVYVQDDTSVDYITVVTCSKLNPIQEIQEVVNKFECSQHERLIKILGGTIDAFSPNTDTPPANPSIQLTNLVNNQNPITGYDATVPNRYFLETLTLPNGNITKAELNIGYKDLPGFNTNDTLVVGDYNTNLVSGHFFPSNTWTDHILSQGWNEHNISNGEKVIQANLSDINNTTGTGNLFSTALSTRHIDIYVQDDTAIDFTQLNLCMAKRRIIHTPGDYIGISAIKESNTSVRISFKDNSDNEDGFKIFGSNIQESIPANDETKHAYVYKTITGLTCNKTYSIQALAYKGNNVSLPTSVRSFNINTTFALPCH